MRGIRLIGIYPVTVGELQYDATGSGKEVTFQITFAYQWWEPYSIGKVIP